tara:strand:- start:5354 stop:7135 length:1782 start_codon:yes stop_codon:yes gene_type:complete
MKVPTYQTQTSLTTAPAAVPSRLQVSGSQLAAGARSTQALAGALDDITSMAFSLYDQRRRDQRELEDLQFQIETQQTLQEFGTNALKTASTDQLFTAETEFDNNVLSYAEEATRNISDKQRRQRYQLFVQSEGLKLKPAIQSAVAENKLDIGIQKFGEELDLILQSAETAPAEMLLSIFDQVDDLYARGVNFGLQSRQEAADNSDQTNRSMAISWSSRQIRTISSLETAYEFMQNPDLLIPANVAGRIDAEDRAEIVGSFNEKLLEVAATEAAATDAASSIASDVERGKAIGNPAFDAIVGSLDLENKRSLVDEIRKRRTEYLNLLDKERSVSESQRNRDRQSLNNEFELAISMQDNTGALDIIKRMKLVDPIEARSLQFKLDRMPFTPQDSDPTFVATVRKRIELGTASFNDLDLDQLNIEDYRTLSDEIIQLEDREVREALTIARGELELPEGITELAEDKPFFKESRIFARVQSALTKARRKSQREGTDFDAMAVMESALSTESERITGEFNKKIKTNADAALSFAESGAVLNQQFETYQDALLALEAVQAKSISDRPAFLQRGTGASRLTLRIQQLRKAVDEGITRDGR